MVFPTSKIGMQAINDSQNMVLSPLDKNQFRQLYSQSQMTEYPKDHKSLIPKQMKSPGIDKKK